MLLAHLSDLHLGHRAYERADGGRNVREQDVGLAFQRAVQEVIRLKPDLILFVGDIFDRPDPPPSAMVTLARGLESIRSALPLSQVFMVAGARDTPRTPTDPGALAALDPFPQVEAASVRARSVFLEDLDTHLFLLPHSGVVRRPYPEVRTRPGVRWNVLLAYAGVGTGAGVGLPLDHQPWDYVALGHLHQHQQVTPNVFYSGSLERVGPEPWREAAQEKGFRTFDLETGRTRFHPIPGRPVVALAPIRIPRGEAVKLVGKVRGVLGEVPGGIEGKIVRLRIEGLSPVEVKREERGLFTELREKALHLAVEVDDFQDLAEDNRLPLVARDRAFALRALRERAREADGEQTMLQDLLADLVGEADPEADPPGLEEALLLRELRGSALPYLGEMSMEAGEGLLGWVGGDGRTLGAFINTLLWGVGLKEDLAGAGRGAEESPTLALRVGVAEASVLLHKGRLEAEDHLHDRRKPLPPWSLPAEGVAMAWCGEGGGTPEQVLSQGSDLLATARGVDALTHLCQGLSARFPGLARAKDPGQLSASDFERLRLEAERADVGVQLQALSDIPGEVGALETELRDLRGAVAEVVGDLEAGTTEWHRERQDAQTHLLSYRDRARELRGRIRRLEALGSDSPCPTCGRLLEDHFQGVLGELQDEWEGIVQDGQWWRRRWEQLEEKPEALKELEKLSRQRNAELETATERLERARSSLREMDELRDRERELQDRLASILDESKEGGSPVETLARYKGDPKDLAAIPEDVAALFDLARSLSEEIRNESRIRLLHRGGRRLNRLTGGRILGLDLGEPDGGVQLVEGGATAGVEAEEDRAAAVVALRMGLVELLAEDWSPLGSFVLGDPFDRMGGEDQLRALGLLRRILSRIPQVLLLTRGPVVERSPESFEGLFEFREDAQSGGAALRSLPAGVGSLRIR